MKLFLKMGMGIKLMGMRVNGSTNSIPARLLSESTKIRRLLDLLSESKRHLSIDKSNGY